MMLAEVIQSQPQFAIGWVRWWSGRRLTDLLVRALFEFVEQFHVADKTGRTVREVLAD